MGTESTRSLSDLLELSSPPVAIAFLDSPPSGVHRVATGEPAGCGYWRLAAEGQVFYTTADDHKACPIGAHTHHVPLTKEESAGLMDLITTMAGLSYIRMEEVPQVPRRSEPMSVAVYAPLAESPVAPDVVLVRGNVRQLMLLAEAAQHAGVAGERATMGRPTCAVLPAAINSNRASASFGCVGNRVYTGAGENDAYFAFPGAQLDALTASLNTIVAANDALHAFHRDRARQSRAGSRA